MKVWIVRSYTGLSDIFGVYTTKAQAVATVGLWFNKLYGVLHIPPETIETFEDDDCFEMLFKSKELIGFIMREGVIATRHDIIAPPGVVYKAEDEDDD